MTCHNRAPRGFTLVEVLVVLIIIGTMISLLLPAINGVRENARRAKCTSHVVQLITAVQAYEETHEVYPPGTINESGPIVNQPAGYHHGWLIQLLPYVERRVIYRNVDRSVGVYHPKNDAVGRQQVQLFLCPSEVGPLETGVSNYAAVHHDVEAPIDADNHGVFFLNSRTRHIDVEDGASVTLFLGEQRMDRAGQITWMSGSRATLRNTGTPINQTRPRTSTPWDPAQLRAEMSEPVDPADPMLTVGGFGSTHVGGANFAFGGGRVKFLGDNLDPRAFQQMGHRADGQLPLPGTALVR